MNTEARDKVEAPLGRSGRFARLWLRGRIGLLVLLLLLTAALLPGVFRLGIGYSAEAFLRTDDPELLELLRHYDSYSLPDNFFLFGVPCEDPLSEESLAALDTLSSRLRGVEGVAHVWTLRNAPGIAGLRGAELRRALRKSHLYRRLFVAFPEDGLEAALAGMVQLDKGARNNEARARVLGALEGFARELPGLRKGDASLELYLAGIPVLRDRYVKLVRADQAFFLPVGALLTIALLFFLLPGLGLAIATVSVVPLTLIWTFGILGYGGKDLSLLTSTLPILLMVISVADAVHLSLRYFEERRAGRAEAEAARRAMARTAFPCLITSLTTMIGFGSMMLAGLPDLSDLGFFAAMGVAVAFALTMLWLPVSLPIFVRLPLLGMREQVSGLLARFGRLSARLGALPLRPVFVFFGLVMIAALFLVSRLEQNSYVMEDLWPDSEIAQELRWFERQFTGTLVGELLVSAEQGSPADKEHEAEAGRFIDWLESRDGVIRSLSFVDYLRDGYPRSLLRGLGKGPLTLLEPNGKRARVLVFMRDIGAQAVDAYFEAVRRKSGELRGLRVKPVGYQVIANRQVTRLIDEVKFSFFLAFLVISVLMGVIFRSARLGLIAMIPNLFPLLMTAAFLELTGEHLRIIAVITFAIAFGLAVDNTIHIVVRYRRCLTMDGGPAAWTSWRERNEAAVRSSLLTVGPAVWTTSILLLTGFIVLLFSGFKGSFDFGELACITIGSALFGDLILLPALLRVLPVRSAPVHRA